MRGIRQVLLLGALGALVGGLSTALVFAVVGLAEGGNVQEVLLYGLFFGVGSAFVGAVVGALVAMVRATWLGGAAIGVAGIALYIIVYALMSGGISDFMRYVRESGFFLVFYAGPTVLAGIITGLVRTRRERRATAAVVDAAVS